MYQIQHNASLDTSSPHYNPHTRFVLNITQDDVSLYDIRYVSVLPLPEGGGLWIVVDHEPKRRC